MFSAGCAITTVGERADGWARQAGLQRLLVAGNGYRHVLYRHRQPASGPRLHVYIDGDGTPWRDRMTVSMDPTPIDPLMLRLIAGDRARSLYLGRPCYFDLQSEPGCHPLLWTQLRYSPAVIDSMAAALRSVLAEEPAKQLVFVGFSGGGTLATLLAARFPETVALVTLAANLDTDAWCDQHGYSRLTGSLNPMSEPALGAAVLQWHYVGLQDRRVPAALTGRYTESHPGAKVYELEGFDHACCWAGIWPQILEKLRLALDGTSPLAQPHPNGTHGATPQR